MPDSVSRGKVFLMNVFDFGISGERSRDHGREPETKPGSILHLFSLSQSSGRSAAIKRESSSKRGAQKSPKHALRELHFRCVTKKSTAHLRAVVGGEGWSWNDRVLWRRVLVPGVQYAAFWRARYL